MEKINLENKNAIEEDQFSPTVLEGKNVQSDGKLNRPFPILLAAFAAAVLLDLLFFEKAWGWHWAVALTCI